MFPCKESMQISSLILGEWSDLIFDIHRIHAQTIAKTHREVEYFREFFYSFQNFINSYKIPGIDFVCKAKEIHRKPIVQMLDSTRCELGDYFINVKYMSNGRLLGKKLIIYQFKIGNGKWNIDQKQLKLMKDWPTFAFGRSASGVKSYNLHPKTVELGSYWLVDSSCFCSRGFYSSGFYSSGFYGSGFYSSGGLSSALDIYNYQHNNRLGNHEAQKIRLCGETGLISQLGWKSGELIEKDSDLSDFLDALYRYIGFDPDPPDEFDGFTTKEGSGSFGGVEIIAKINME